MILKGFNFYYLIPCSVKQNPDPFSFEKAKSAVCLAEERRRSAQKCLDGKDGYFLLIG
jgi:hypothetical protein